MVGVEKFTFRKFLGVIASLIGIILISRVDLSSSSPSPDDNAHNGDDNNNNDGNSSFPHKTMLEIALGDAMAAFSAMMYGVYTVVMKRQVGDESRVNMQLFFGMVGLFNVVLLWPGFIILHFTGLEPFSLPGSGEVWIIVLVRRSCSPFLVGSPLRWVFHTDFGGPLSSDQCHHFAHIRYLLGLRHAADDPTCGHRGTQPDHSVVSDRADGPTVVLRQSIILGRCCCGLFLVRGGQ